MLRRIAENLCVAAAALAIPAAPALPAERARVTVFAAASLQEVLAMTRLLLSRRMSVRLVFGASSTLARQIVAGAPADVFVSAHPRWMDWLLERAEKGTGPRIRISGRRTVLANSLVLIGPRSAKSQTGPDPVPWADVDLVRRLGRGRLAVGDPDHVPVGLYAEAALRRLGLWQALAPRLARTGNTRAALALVARGEAPLGLVYRSDARASRRVRVIANLPARFHPPIRYEAAVVIHDGKGNARRATARRFVLWLARAAAVGAFENFGFRPPPYGQGR